MWKWIVGALLVLVVAIAGFCYVAVKKITAGGDTVTVTVAATPERVFAALADPDSMQAWMMPGTLVGASHRGVVVIRYTSKPPARVDAATSNSPGWFAP